MSFETRARTLAFLCVPKLISGRSIAIFFLVTNSYMRGRTESTSIIESRLASADWLPVEPRLLSRLYSTDLCNGCWFKNELAIQRRHPYFARPELCDTELPEDTKRNQTSGSWKILSLMTTVFAVIKREAPRNAEENDNALRCSGLAPCWRKLHLILKRRRLNKWRLKRWEVPCNKSHII